MKLYIEVVESVEEQNVTSSASWQISGEAE